MSSNHTDADLTKLVVDMESCTLEDQQAIAAELSTDDLVALAPLVGNEEQAVIQAELDGRADGVDEAQVAKALGETGAGVGQLGDDELGAAIDAAKAEGDDVAVAALVREAQVRAETRARVAAADVLTDGQQETADMIERGELFEQSEPIDQDLVEDAVGAGVITPGQGMSITAGYGDPAAIETVKAFAATVDTTVFEVGAINCYAQPITLVGKDVQPGELLTVTGEAELAAVLGLKSGWFIDGAKIERHHIVDFAVRNVATDERAVYRRIKNEAGEKVAVRVDVELEQTEDADAQAAATA